MTLDFVQFDVIYSRQGESNRWSRKIERRPEPIEAYWDGVDITSGHFEGDAQEKRIQCTTNVWCNPLVHDPNTIMTPEDWRELEEDACMKTDKTFKTIHPGDEILI